LLDDQTFLLNDFVEGADIDLLFEIVGFESLLHFLQEQWLQNIIVDIAHDELGNTDVLHEKFEMVKTLYRKILHYFDVRKKMRFLFLTNLMIM
jgi:hypothetical protein